MDKDVIAIADEVDARPSEHTPSRLPTEASDLGQHVTDNNIASVKITVTNAKGTPVGVIETIKPWNDHIKAILQIPVVRRVKLRLGRNFTENQLANVCDRSDPNGGKILAYVIQAGGQVMEKGCENCTEKRGPFDGCVVLNGTPYLKCGNCEWGNQSCHGPLSSGAEPVEGQVRKELTNTNQWEICQIKTGHFASSKSVMQCLSWAEGEQSFKHWVLRDTKPEATWGVLCELDFEIRLKDIAQVKWNVEAWLVHLKMRESSSALVKEGVMVAFAGETTAMSFLQFCRQLDLSIPKQEV